MRYLFPILFLIACSKSTQQLPLSEEKIIQIIADMQVAEAALVGLSGSVRDSTAEVYYEEIYTLHGTDKLTVVETMDLLQMDPTRLEKIYSEVMRELETQGATKGDPVD